ncbi:hypothetical protein [Rhizobium sp. BT03]|uniref:hypothetical protein n=1 Tax=Rhizobium sp. BT03 TaxID=3045156 RepID=UPI0024B3D5D6|nr:hypothetical protein [Rhizobium sp. BT03]WHO73753.1 hypothetical protein QMO80_002803 [Rhizobium sp. BT03]
MAAASSPFEAGVVIWYFACHLDTKCGLAASEWLLTFIEIAIGRAQRSPTG